MTSAAKGQEELMDDVPETEIGEIGNYYGGLWVKVESGQAMWGIENYDGIGWMACPPGLCRALLDYEVNRDH